jgi:hypothetical protein
MFNQEQIQVVSKAVEIAEDVTANYFKISTGQWKYARYDIRTLAELKAEEITEYAFAQIIRYTRKSDHTLPRERHYDFFKICLQDHNILAAVDRDEPLQLFPLVVYVVTHELVHVVRFCKFLQNFEADLPERQKEEKQVHKITQQALSRLNLPDLDHVLRAYQDYRFMERFQDHARVS